MIKTTIPGEEKVRTFNMQFHIKCQKYPKGISFQIMPSLEQLHALWGMINKCIIVGNYKMAFQLFLNLFLFYSWALSTKQECIAVKADSV